MDVSSQILELEDRAHHLRKETYSSLTPTQKLQVARHPHRPTFLDIVLNSTDMWMEIHGDRAGYDDPALVCGLGTIEGQTFMFIGHQKVEYAVSPTIAIALDSVWKIGQELGLPWQASMSE